MKATIAALETSGHLRPVDAALGNWIARAFPADGPEVALAAALVARAVGDGHSALVLDRAQAWLAGADAQAKPATLPPADAWQAILRRADAVRAWPDLADNATTPLVLDRQGRLYLNRYFAYEQQLASAIVQRAASTSGAQSRTPTQAVPAGLDTGQQRAVNAALDHRFTLITGGPGTGKTHSVVRVLAALATNATAHGTTLRMALAAPTGKAAARLRESVGRQLGDLHLGAAIAAQIPADATTVHRLIGANPWSSHPRHNHATPLPFDVVVVDEVSMLDLPLMAKLVDAVPADARLIVLGDPDQLAAVEAGHVLGALVQAATSTPLRDCHIALTHGHRFGLGSALGALAAAITQGDAAAAARALHRDPDVVLMDAHLAAIADAAAAAYRPVLAASGPAAALQAAKGFRLLTALRRGPSGCLALDAAIAARLARSIGQHAHAREWPGRLILVTTNRPELGLFNGDTGVLWPDADRHPRAWFEGTDGKPRAFAPAALPPHEGAFALTVHKAQGSEFDHVALVTGPDSAVLTRELLYTGVTRARSGLQLYTSDTTLAAGIARPTLRMTGLADRLREANTQP